MANSRSGTQRTAPILVAVTCSGGRERLLAGLLTSFSLCKLHTIILPKMFPIWPFAEKVGRPPIDRVFVPINIQRTGLPLITNSCENTNLDKAGEKLTKINSAHIQGRHRQTQQELSHPFLPRGRRLQGHRPQTRSVP